MSLARAHRCSLNAPAMSALPTQCHSHPAPRCCRRASGAVGMWRRGRRPLLVVLRCSGARRLGTLREPQHVYCCGRASPALVAGGCRAHARVSPGSCRAVCPTEVSSPGALGRERATCAGSIRTDTGWHGRRGNSSRASAGGQEAASLQALVPSAPAAEGDAGGRNGQAMSAGGGREEALPEGPAGGGHAQSAAARLPKGRSQGDAAPEAPPAAQAALELAPGGELREAELPSSTGTTRPPGLQEGVGEPAPGRVLRDADLASSSFVEPAGMQGRIGGLAPGEGARPGEQAGSLNGAQPALGPGDVRGLPRAPWLRDAGRASDPGAAGPAGKQDPAPAWREDDSDGGGSSASEVGAGAELELLEERVGALGNKADERWGFVGGAGPVSEDAADEAGSDAEDGDEEWTGEGEDADQDADEADDDGDDAEDAGALHADDGEGANDAPEALKARAAAQVSLAQLGVYIAWTATLLPCMSPA